MVLVATDCLTVFNLACRDGVRTSVRDGVRAGERAGERTVERAGERAVRRRSGGGRTFTGLLALYLSWMHVLATTVNSISSDTATVNKAVDVGGELLCCSALGGRLHVACH